MENNIIRLFPPELKGGKINYLYEVYGKWKEGFCISSKFSIEYSIDISDVPESILIIPALCNILPISWVADAVIEVQECDEEFYNCIPEIKAGYINMYPQLYFGGVLKADRIVKNKSNATQERSIVFFSGGVDAFFTLINHLDENPILLTLWGADLKLDDSEGWYKVSKHIRSVSEEFELDNITATSSFREFLCEKELNKYIKKSGEKWWHGFQHGIGIIGHAAPLAYHLKIKTVYIASSFSIREKGQVTCASDPTIDNNVRFYNVKTLHDGYDFNRQNKINTICKFSEETGKAISLRVCWESHGGGNCCNCEKCYRTIYGIIASGCNPSSYGFNYTKHTLSDAEKKIKKSYIFAPYYKPLWNDVKEQFLTKPQIIEKYPEVKWIYDYDFNKINDSLRKKISHSFSLVLLKKCYHKIIYIIFRKA